VWYTSLVHLPVHLASGRREEQQGDAAERHIVFFEAPGMILSLWDRAKLAEDGGIDDSGSWGGVTIGHCLGSPDRAQSG
jgi:hypothetical protein